MKSTKQKTILVLMAAMPLFAATKPVSKLIDLPILSVAEKADILKESPHRPFTTVLVGIHVQAEPMSVCAEVAGQVTKLEGKMPGSIDLLQSVDPVNDLCIAIAVLPVDLVVTYPVEVVTGGIIAAHGETVNRVRIGKKTYEVVVNSDNGEAYVRPAAR
ncbi:MAG: hypothetical protein HYZ71_12015 [Deltaproteobacteria bacterium]|nr:hypothetical protein [Deltaproteobacteria bacterium]